MNRTYLAIGNGRLLFLIIGVCLMQTYHVVGQYSRCGHDAKMDVLFKSNPQYREAIESGFESFKQYSKSSKVPDVVTIPVHVIIVHEPTDNIGQGSNLSMDRIRSQIDVINQDFRRLNADTLNTPLEFNVGDTYIQFALAQIDPVGMSTNGVTRYATSLDFDENESEIKSATIWDRDTYLNIWVAPTLDDLGFAYTPSTTSLPNAQRDGCAVLTYTFGGPGFATFFPYDLGRTSTHEIGHFLGLRHIWRSNGCSTDDGIDDTPRQDTSHFNCPTHPMPSCSNNGDMFMNYMDYVNDDCMNAFSVGQGDYMRMILNTSRSSLLTAAERALNPMQEELAISISNQINPPCYNTFSGQITVSASGGAGNYRYQINNRTPQSSPIFNFLKAGQYTIKVIDNDNQEVSINVELVDPDPLEIEVTIQDSIRCHGNLATLKATGVGGTLTDLYTYRIASVDTNTSGLFENLAAGFYEVVIEDDNTCTDTARVDIIEPDELFFQVLNVLPINCTQASGGVDIAIQGGTPSYAVFVDGIEHSGSTLRDLSEGQHTILVEDVNGCGTAELIDIIKEDSVEIVDVMITDEQCLNANDGGITVLANRDDVRYRIDGLALQEQNVFNPLIPGLYTVYVEDGVCVDSLLFEIEEARDPEIDIDIWGTPLCAQDRIDRLRIWSINVEPYYVDSISVDGVITVGEEVEGLMAGFHQLGVYYGGCQVDTTIHIMHTSDLDLEVDVSPVSCFGNADGAVDLSGLAGVPPYEYSFNNVFYHSTTTYLGFQPGEYSAYVKDSVGCISQVTFDMPEPDPLYVDTVILQNGDLEISVSGGSPPYYYSLDGVIFELDSSYSNVDAGSITIYIRDENDCSIDTSLVLTQVSETLESSIRLYPNPAFDYIEISDDGNIVDDFNYVIYNPHGAVVAVDNVQNQSRIDIRDLLPGTYIVQIDFDSHRIVRKLVVF